MAFRRCLNLPSQNATVSATSTPQQQIAGGVHRLHGVVGATPVGMVLCCCALPGLRHLCFGEPAGEGKMQPLAGDDRLEIGVLAEGAPVGGAEPTAAFAARPAAGTC